MAIPTFPITPPTEGVTNEILLMGQRFPLQGAVTVVTYDQPGAMSFYTTDAGPDGMPTYGPRYEKPGLKVTTWEQLEKHLTQVIIHTDLTNDSASCFRALVGRSLSSHFLIDWDGVMYQPLDPMDCGYHAGEGNQKAIGLDMNGRLPNLEREPDAKAYEPSYSRFSEIEPDKKHKRPRSERMEVNGAKVRSYGYTDGQYMALIELLKRCTKLFPEIKAQYPVDPKGDVVPRTLDEPLGFAGFMAHWHWEAQRWDPGPGFDWQRVFHALGNEHNSFPVELEKGKNIKSLLQPTLVKEYAEQYYKNNETQTTGWYPMGINQTWHNGVHLAAPRGSPVMAMTDGVLVAARFGKNPTKLGHNNFMLLRHTVPVPGKDKTVEPKKFVFYSLYMHLEPLDVMTVGETTPNWVKELYRLKKGTEEDKPAEDEPPPPATNEDGEPKEEGEEPAEVDADAADSVDEDVWLEVGEHGEKVIDRGFVSKVAWKKNPINILAGETIGTVGMFGPEGEWKSQVHIEVFADTGWKDAVDIGIHGRFLIELDDDVGPDLFVENRDILSLFGTPRRTSSLLPSRVLDQATIESFWMLDTEYTEEKSYLRKVVVRHVSEWSDRVDWVSSLSEADDWYGKVADFKKILKGTSIANDAISTVLPFIWLSKDVAEHIGIDVSNWRGILDYFHPIHFLMWLTYNSTQRIQTLSTGLTSAAAKKKAKEREKLTEECRLLYTNREEARTKSEAGDKKAAQCFDYLTDESRSESTQVISESEELPDVEVLKEWLGGSDQGEWKRAAPDEE